MKLLVLIAGCGLFLGGGFGVFLIQPQDLNAWILSIPLVLTALGGLGLILHQRWGLYLSNLMLAVSSVSVATKYFLFEYIFWFGGGIVFYFHEGSWREHGFSLFIRNSGSVNILWGSENAALYHQAFGEETLFVAGINVIAIAAIGLLNFLWDSSKLWEYEPKRQDQYMPAAKSGADEAE